MTAPITQAEIGFYLAVSVPTSNPVAGNTTSSSPGNSLGGFLSTTAINASVALDNLFIDLTGSQNATSGYKDYACIFIVNNTAGGNTMQNVVAWLPSASVVAGGADIDFAADTTNASPKGQTVTPQALIIANAQTCPSGLSTWQADVGTAPTAPSFTGGVQLGSIPPGYCKAVWIRRTARNSGAVNADGFGIQIDFDTAG